MQHFYIQMYKHATKCTHCQVLRPKNYIVSLHMKNKFMKMKILCMKMKFLAHYITNDGKIPNFYHQKIHSQVGFNEGVLHT